MNLDEDITTLVYRGNVHSMARWDWSENIASFGFPRNIRYNISVQLTLWQHLIFRFNSSSHIWEMSLVGSSEHIEARSIATLETYLLGRSAFVIIIIIIMIIIITIIITTISITTIIIRQNWTIEGDDYRCSQGKPYTTTLKLTGLS